MRLIATRVDDRSATSITFLREGIGCVRSSMVRSHGSLDVDDSLNVDSNAVFHPQLS